MRDEEIAHAVFDVLRAWLDAGRLAVAGRSPQDLATALHQVPGIIRAELRPSDADLVEGGEAWPVRADMCLNVIPAATGWLAEALGCAAAMLGALGERQEPTTHVLRGPLTPILAYAELLGDSAFGPLNPAQRRAVAAITRNAMSMSELLTEAAVPSEGP
jgi:signal transduction histidine kinase